VIPLLFSLDPQLSSLSPRSIVGTGFFFFFWHSADVFSCLRLQTTVKSFGRSPFSFRWPFWPRIRIPAILSQCIMFSHSHPIGIIERVFWLSLSYDPLETFPSHIFIANVDGPLSLPTLVFGQSNDSLGMGTQ